jgi:ribosomal protein S18 acetylase RimI-like enzyme
VTEPGSLACGASALRRADSRDLPAVVALQRTAYARNRALLGVEPLPLLADYDEIARAMEVWVAREDGRIAGVLILERRIDDLLVWSIATDPAAQGRGLGKGMLAAAEARARQLGQTIIRLYTGTPLEHLISWYGRHGFEVEREEALSDRSITHMIKRLEPPGEPVRRCPASPPT